MVKNNNYLDVQEVLKNVVVPKDENLVLLKIKETFQVSSEDINVETIKDKKVYSVRYEEIQFQLTIDYGTKRFILSPHFDVFDENDEIIESY